jgi:hypothetical protein
MHCILWLIIGGILGWVASLMMHTDAQQGIFPHSPGVSGRPMNLRWSEWFTPRFPVSSACVDEGQSPDQSQNNINDINVLVCYHVIRWKLEKAGFPAVTICTDIFAETAHAMAQMWGAPDYLVILTTHPLSGLTRQQ